MTPAALLVCMTIVTNVNHGSVATNACHYELPAIAMVPVDPMPIAAIDAVKTQDTGIKALAVVDLAPKVKPAKPGLGKVAVKAARVHHRAGALAASPVLTAAQDKAFRHSWFKRLADM
jgi:hypothetical protein